MNMGKRYGMRLFLLGIVAFSIAIMLVAAVGSAASPATMTGPVNYTAGTSPRGMASADVNGDGKLDLIVVNRDSNNVSILLGVGDGTFGAASNYAAAPAGSYPASPAAADFNGDGKLDLAVTSQFPDSVQILIGAGDGSFGAPTTVSSGTYPYGIVAADVNKDGKMDLVDSSYNTSKKINVLLGNGNGTFSAPASYVVAGSYATGIALADFNGDGNLDAVTANNNANTVTISLGDGAGAFSNAALANYGSYTVPANPRGITTGDFNNDGKVDVASANATSISILLGLGNGNFSAPVSINDPSGSQGRSIIAGDFNLDGKTDLAVASKTAANNIITFMGNGNGTFDAPVTYTGGSSPDGPQSVITADLNGDGKADIATANYTGGNVSVLLNASVPPCTPAKPSLTVGTHHAYWGSYADYLSRDLSVQLTVSNTGSGTAYGAAITGSSNNNGVTLNTAMPLSVGDIAGSSSTSATVMYHIPTGVTGFSAGVTGSASDACGTSYTYPV